MNRVPYFNKNLASGLTTNVRLSKGLRSRWIGPRSYMVIPCHTKPHGLCMLIGENAPTNRFPSFQRVVTWEASHVLSSAFPAVQLTRRLSARPRPWGPGRFLRRKCGRRGHRQSLVFGKWVGVHHISSILHPFIPIGSLGWICHPMLQAPSSAKRPMLVYST